MVILPNTVHVGKDEPNLFLSDLGLCSGQMYKDGYKRVDVIINFSNWYSAEGAYWGEGALSADDFWAIFKGLKNHHDLAFFIIPQEAGLFEANNDITPDEVAECCRFIITTSSVYIFNDCSPYVVQELSKREIPSQYAKRYDAKNIIALY